MELRDKVALVTGAGRGIGREIALSLAAEGCKVLLVSRTEPQLKEAVREISDAGGRAAYLAVDLGEKESVGKVIKAVMDEYRGIDILINNAAVLYNTEYEEVTEAEWDKVMDINIKAPFFLSQKALSEMKKRGEGYIINISSTAAITVPPAIATYGISKKSIIGLSEALYETAKKYNVKVSTIYPGMTDTEMLRGFNPPVSPDRWMLPEDILGCILFLLKQSRRVVVKELTPWSTGHDQI